ncbi:sterol desaturase family protein [Paenibacillus thermotolerans]|uniref:sterol desaturase family protein n=1 Tax=Paenibacillus thermotolerans TaxID=3027807 RepID=UPI002368BEE3|nr:MULTISPECIES: sterol desaturase family protein [unclassified Paenibacillus]
MRYFVEFITHRLIVFLTCTFLVSAAVACLYPWSGRTVLYAAVGALLVLITEYTVHRYMLHQFPALMPAAYRGHQAHHQNPSDIRYLFGPVRYDFISYALMFFFAWLLSRNVGLAAALTAGAGACQLYYQWKHYIAHRPVTPLTPWGRWLKKLHLLHHHLDEHAWYGVSNPFFDAVMGTYRRDRRKKSSASQSKTL